MIGLLTAVPEAVAVVVLVDSAFMLLTAAAAAAGAPARGLSWGGAAAAPPFRSVVTIARAVLEGAEFNVASKDHLPVSTTFFGQ